MQTPPGFHFISPSLSLTPRSIDIRKSVCTSHTDSRSNDIFIACSKHLAREIERIHRKTINHIYKIKIHIHKLYPELNVASERRDRDVTGGGGLEGVFVHYDIVNR